MKTIQLTAREFALFKALANRLQIIFMYSVDHGTILVEADASSLEGLGY
jgi:hypothetical protein